MFVMQPVHRRTDLWQFFSFQHCPPGLTVESTRHAPEQVEDRSPSATIPVRIRNGSRIAAYEALAV
jgi:hypothetical protein